jgi:hypothetical protein
VSLFTAAVGTPPARHAQRRLGVPALVGGGSGSYTPPITSVSYRTADGAADTGSVTWSFESPDGADT